VCVAFVIAVAGLSRLHLRSDVYRRKLIAKRTIDGFYRTLIFDQMQFQYCLSGLKLWQ